MDKIIRKKLNLDLVLKDVEKYCYSEISYEKIKNLEFNTEKKYEIIIEKNKQEKVNAISKENQK